MYFRISYETTLLIYRSREKPNLFSVETPAWPNLICKKYLHVIWEEICIVLNWIKRKGNHMLIAEIMCLDFINPG